MIFVVIGTGMIFLAAALVAVPLWRARPRFSLSPEIANQEVFATRLEELKRDIASGRLADEDFTAARRDLERELLTPADSPDTIPTIARNPRWLAGVVAGIMAGACFGLYFKVGNWRAGVQGVHAASVSNVEQMVATLAHRLNTTDSGNLQGWIMLGRSYLVMGEYPQSAAAFERARALSHDHNAEALSGYAQAIALQYPADFMVRAAPLFEQVLKLDPTNADGLWYGGLIAFAAGDKTLAVERWRTLLGENPPTKFRALIVSHIQAAGGQIQNPTVTVSNGITVQVALDPRLRDRVSPNETLFLFAEPAGHIVGPPLAVRRFQVRDLPLDVTLSDADSLPTYPKLSMFTRVEIIARISRQGNPLPESGDLTGEVRWQRGTTRTPVHILINQVLP